MFQPQAVFTFLRALSDRPFSLKGKITRKIALLLLFSALLPSLSPYAAQAAGVDLFNPPLAVNGPLLDNPAPPKALTQKVEELNQQLAILRQQEVELNNREEELKDKINLCCSNQLSAAQLESQSAELAQAKAAWQENKAQVEQELKQNQLFLNGFQVAEEVRAATNWPEYSKDLYDRIGYSWGIYSDCTWYAAEALRQASAGHINLNGRNFGNWGNAGNWFWGAKNYLQRNPDGLIAGADKIPQAGDIIEWPGGHVAFVENVAEVRDDGGKLYRYLLTISEESANGQATNKNAVRVKLNDATGWVRRWRFIQAYSVSAGTGVNEGVRFIHFNYDANWYN